MATAGRSQKWAIAGNLQFSVMTRSLELETLRLLVAVAEAGSLNAAAGRCGISQPAASARIKEFEARWQVAVLHRSARGSRLTEDGQAVISWARGLLHAADRVVTSLESLSAQRQAGVAVAASLTIAEHLLPPWLGELHTSHPQIRPVLRVLNSDTVAAELRRGTVELGFVETSLMPLGLARATVGHDRLVVVVGPDHPWARRVAPLPRDELRRAHWVLREPGSGTRSTFESALQQEPAVALEGSSTTALIGAAVAGVGPAVVSALSVRTEIETGRLREVPIELDLCRPLTAVWRRGERLGEAASRLLGIATRTSGRSRPSPQN
jgi:DNA-binding transcriptional LysR family regulator